MMTAMVPQPGSRGKSNEESLLHALSEPSAIAKSIVSLASSGYITGQTISLDSRML